MHAPRDFAQRGFSAKLRRVLPLAAMALVPLSLTACGDHGAYRLGPFDMSELGTTLTVQDPGDEKFQASDEPYRLGVEQFNRGYYGNAQKYFQEAVEKSPQDVAAWLSLAACYDQLRRFDFADKAYDRAIALGGITVQLLNNQGYSYVLRGDLRRARKKFEEALDRDPDNVMVQNNLKRIDLSQESSRRSHG
jgi:Flp pilus assembly protein TadD